MKAPASQPITTTLLLLAILVVAANAWISFRAVALLGNTETAVTHTWQVISSVDRLLSSMKDVEAGDRGFLLTGDPAYLAPYTQALSDLPFELASVTALTSDNAQQQRRVAQIQTLIATRIAILKPGIEARAASRAGNTRSLTSSGPGKAQMDQLRVLTAAMQETERRLLLRRMAGSKAARLRAQTTVTVASLLDLVLIVLLLMTLSRERRQRFAAVDTAERLRQLQSISDIGLTQLTLPELTSELLERVRQTIDADAAVLCMWRDEQLEVVEGSGTNVQRGRRIQLTEDDPIYIAAKTNKVMAFTDTEARNVPLEGLRRDMRALLVIPLSISGRVVGTLLAGRKRADAFRDRDEELLAFAADRIALSLDRANAYESERDARRVAELSTLEVQSLNDVLEERVRLRTAELEATNRELEAFSYSVSHDLRAPLRSVDGFSVALEEDFKELLPPDARDYLRRIRAGVQKMGMLIDALLQLSRITRTEISREPTDLSSLAEDVAAELRHQHPARNLSFRIEPGLKAEADPRLLRVALENLIGNAVKFTSKQSDALIEFGHNQGTGEYFVRDNGAGFDNQYAGKLFTAFQRLHGDKDFVGSGIGLATVGRVIRRHHGSIRAEGHTGKGAIFWFTLGLE